MSNSRSDSVSLDKLVGKKRKPACGSFANVKVIVALFLIFVFVSSDIFTNHVVSGFPGAVNQRSPSSYGIAVQATFLVLFYILVTYMVENGIV
jgi:hypothetical protein